MTCSIIICTYNRCALLKKTLDSLFSQSISRDLFEIVVVDNGSSDNTRHIVETASISRSVNVSYFLEISLGLSHARNTGIDNAQGEIILFIDDDAIPEKDWLASMIKAFADPRVAAAGGPVKPMWEADRPAWLPDKWLSYLSVDEFGDLLATREYTNHRCPVGTNMAFRKSTLGTDIRFPTALGRKGANLISNEEIVVCRELLARGEVIRFVPEAVVYHHVAPERLQKQWFYRRVYWQGRSDVMISKDSFVNNVKNSIIWSGAIVKNGLFSCVPGESSRFSATMMVCLHWGKLSGLFRSFLNPEETPR